MLKEIYAKEINLSLESFKEKLEEYEYMIEIKITEDIALQITKRNSGIKLIFDNEKYRIMPNAVIQKDNEWCLEISAWGRIE
jgi:hypothetical protein